MFGHEQGAFTGATRRHQGWFEAAEGGTLFLDEIGDLKLALQSRLLRVIEGHPFRRVGGKENVVPNVRVVCGTHCDLARAVRQGTFREDLFYRIGIATVRIPPLRARLDDIPDLAMHFLRGAQGASSVKRLSEAALDKLLHYDWPGNVRELAGVVTVAALRCDSDVILEHHIDFPLVQTEIASRASSVNGRDSVMPLEDMKRRYVCEVLTMFGGNKTAAAQALKIDRRIVAKFSRHARNEAKSRQL
jgi:two-component system response regulator HydG